MTVADQNEIADLRARLAGLRMAMHARKLRMSAGERTGRRADADLLQPVMAEIVDVRLRLRLLGARFM